jgi:hypothetical protein
MLIRTTTFVDKKDGVWSAEDGGAHHGQEREKWSMNEKKNFANEKKKTLRVSRRGGSGSAQGIIL